MLVIMFYIFYYEVMIGFVNEHDVYNLVNYRVDCKVVIL